MLKLRGTWPQVRWLFGGIALVVLALVIVWVLFVPAPDWLAHHDVGSTTGSVHETALDNARGRLLTLAAGLLAAGALVFTARNFTLSREGHVTDRYTKAIEQLGSDKRDVRIGGIYALERIARDSRRDHPTVMEVLTAFIREHSREPDATAPDRSTLRPDVQAALTVVGRRDPRHDIRPIDLTRADLTGVTMISADLTSADLTGAKLAGAVLTGAVLTGAILYTADLTGANLFDADLTRANLQNANLTSAFLILADLKGASLGGATLSDTDLAAAKLADAELAAANLTGAQLTDADLTRADLRDANIGRANLSNANLTAANLNSASLGDADLTSAKLTRADLTGANLGGANLGNADLTGANLRDANLSDAYLSAADLKGVADLTRVNFRGARWPENAPPPGGWTLNTGSGRLEESRPDSRPTEVN